MFKYHDSEVGKAWDYSGRYANVKYFELTKEMYAKGQMLMLDGDSPGKWTAKQEELIKCLAWERSEEIIPSCGKGEESAVGCRREVAA